MTWWVRPARRPTSCPTGYRCNSNLECIGLSESDDDGDDDASSAAADDAAADDAAAELAADDDDEDDAAAGTASADDDDDDDAAGTRRRTTTTTAPPTRVWRRRAVDATHVVLVVRDDMGFNDDGAPVEHRPRRREERRVDDARDRPARGERRQADWYIYTPRRGRAQGATLLRVTVRSPFLRYYSAATCTPARGALMTGLHWARLGLWWSNIEATSPWAMPLSTPTATSRLRERRVATHLVGKWDIGHCNRSHWPTARGFETFYGLLGPEYANYTSHAVYTLDATDDDEIAGALAGWSGARRSRSATSSARRAVEGASAQRFSFDDADECLSTSLFAARAAKIIGEHRASASLFLTLAFNAVHNIVSTPRAFWRDRRGQARAQGDEALGRRVAARDLRRRARARRRRRRHRVRGAALVGAVQPHRAHRRERQRRHGQERRQQLPAAQREGDVLGGRLPRARLRALGAAAAQRARRGLPRARARDRLGADAARGPARLARLGRRDRRRDQWANAIKQS